LVLVLFLAFTVKAQNVPEVTVSLNEGFLNSFLDAIFLNLETPKFQLSKVQSPKSKVRFEKTEAGKPKIKERSCEGSITLLRENNGVKTAIRFESDKLTAPIAFAGVYDIPLVGCSNFRGVANANISLEYNREQQILFGRVKVTKVDLNGVPGLASGIVAKLVQGSIDNRINPIEILRTEQVSAIVPVRYANGSIKLRAVDMKSEIINNALNVRVMFELTKAQ
jgi:hypothetical protein